ncbi:MAG: M56 family metallopeptidase [Planctomycetota bacterium]
MSISDWIRPGGEHWLEDWATLSIKISVVLAAALALRAALRSAPARVRCAIWTLGLTGALLLPLLSWMLPTWHVPIWAGVERLPEVTPPAIELVPGIATPAPLQGSASGTTDWASIIFILWAVGASLVLARFGAGLLAAARLVRRSRPLPGGWQPLAECSRDVPRRHVRLRTSSEIQTPITFGIRKPSLILPAESAQWSQDRRRIVLLHELSHIERRDWLVQLLSVLTCACHWYNPLAWIAARRLAIDREHACDDRVLERGTRPSDYASHLVAIARVVGRPRPSCAALPFYGRSSSLLEQRVRSILRPGSTTRRAASWATLANMAVLIIWLAVLQPFALTEAPVMAEADGADPFEVGCRALDRQDWPVAVDRFRSALDRDPSDARSWLGLGFSLKCLDRLESAEKALLQVRRHTRCANVVGQAAYQLACLSARSGRLKPAIEHLERAVRCRTPQPRALRFDPELAWLRREPRFQALLAEVEAW